MSDFIRPGRLRPGDTVAVLSPSWGGPSRYPHVFDLGLRNLQSEFGLKIKELPTARRDADDLYRNPQTRAEDINAAFADEEVRAIVASIGGDDSVRILPYLDLDTILGNPKILLGYSDTTTLTSYLNQKGLVTFNGPAVMAGFAQMRHLPPEFAMHVRRVLMEPEETMEYRAYPAWANDYIDWNTPDYDGETAPLRPHDGWRWLQGGGVHTGRLFGGCIEVFEFLKATAFWPDPGFWDGKILFFETSEDKPSIQAVIWWLRNYGSAGILDRIVGVLFGRARDYSDEEKRELDSAILRVVAGEFGRTDLSIVTNLDFGHTDPQWILPLGVMAEIDFDGQRLRLLEPAAV
ncbi:LD-carboxypeptidase [bacterium]|nr:MAG: LD-carboxypeptidase [bacterium]